MPPPTLMVTITLAMSRPSKLITASDCAANASFSSIRSISSKVSPVELRQGFERRRGPLHHATRHHDHDS